jgi:hypothetical protein
MLAGWWLLNRYVSYPCITASFLYNMCVSSASLAQFHACELVRRGRQELIRVLLPHTMVPQFVPYINFYDTTGTEQGCILTKSITIFNPLSLKDL